MPEDLSLPNCSRIDSTYFIEVRSRGLDSAGDQKWELSEPLADVRRTFVDGWEVDFAESICRSSRLKNTSGVRCEGSLRVTHCSAVEMWKAVLTEGLGLKYPAYYVTTLYDVNVTSEVLTNKEKASYPKGGVSSQWLVTENASRGWKNDCCDGELGEWKEALFEGESVLLPIKF